MAGMAKSWNVTMVETGLPGKPKSQVLPQRPKTVGFPGRRADRVKKELRTHAFQNWLDKVILTHGHAPR